MYRILVEGGILIYKNSCCFFGHREIIETEDLRKNLFVILEALVKKEEVEIFVFGSKSRFNNLCYEMVTKPKEKYPKISRIYIRGEYENANDSYISYFLEKYEETYFSVQAVNATKAVYIKRNYEMIDLCERCVIYYNEKCMPKTRKSGTKIALDYAIKKSKKIYLISGK